MTGFDVPTAFAITGLLFLVMPVIIWPILARQSTDTVALWCNGGLAVGAGVILLGARAYVPSWASYPLANFLIVAGTLMRIQSLRTEMNMPDRASWMTIGAIVVIVNFELIRQVLVNAQLCIQYMLFVYSILFGFAGTTAFQFNRKFSTPSSHWITGSYLLISTAVFLRLNELSFAHVERPDGIDFSSANLLLVIAAILGAIIPDIAYAGMKLEQNQKKLLKSDKRYEAILGTTLDGFFVIDGNLAGGLGNQLRAHYVRIF